MLKIKANNNKGYYELVNGGALDIAYASSIHRRGRVQENGRICPAICTTNEIVIVRW